MRRPAHRRGELDGLGQPVLEVGLPLAQAAGGLAAGGVQAVAGRDEVGGEQVDVAARHVERAVHEVVLGAGIRHVAGRAMRQRVAAGDHVLALHVDLAAFQRGADLRRQLFGLVDGLAVLHHDDVGILAGDLPGQLGEAVGRLAREVALDVVGHEAQASAAFVRRAQSQAHQLGGDHQWRDQGREAPAPSERPRARHQQQRGHEVGRERHIAGDLHPPHRFGAVAKSEREHHDDDQAGHDEGSEESVQARTRRRGGNGEAVATASALDFGHLFSRRVDAGVAVAT